MPVLIELNGPGTHFTFSELQDMIIVTKVGTRMTIAMFFTRVRFNFFF